MTHDSRRDFLKSAAIGSAALAVNPGPIGAALAADAPRIAYAGGYKASTGVTALELLDLIEIEQRAA